MKTIQDVERKVALKWWGKFDADVKEIKASRYCTGKEVSEADFHSSNEHVIMLWKEQCEVVGL